MRGSDQPCRSMASSLKNLNLKQLHPLKSFDAGCVPADVAPDSFAWRFLTALSYHGKRNVRRLATTIMHRLKSLGGQPILDCCNVSCPCTSMLLCHCGPNSSERRLLLRLDCLSMCFFWCVCVSKCLCGCCRAYRMHLGNCVRCADSYSVVTLSMHC